MNIISHVRVDGSSNDCSCITHVWVQGHGERSRSWAHNHVKAGNVLRVGSATGPKVEAYGDDYIRSEGNGTKTDNLLALPRF